MGSCMVEKFKHYIDLTKDEENLIKSLEEREENYKSGDIIRRKGGSADDLIVLKSGWAFISNQLDQNIRSIFNVKLHGDIIGISELSFDKYLYDFVALTDVTICPFPKKNLNEIFAKSERLSRVFYTILSREQSILYERIVSIGRRTALEKVAHFMVEISVRLGMLGMSIDKKFDFPIRQEHIADILGLSSIHVNRSMNELKRHGYIEYDRTSLTILDKEKLLSLANFNELFLQKPNISWHNHKTDVAA